MAKFVYKGRNEDGKPIRSSIIANDRSEALRKLLSQGLTITELRERIEIESDGELFSGLSKPKPRQILAFIKQTAFLLKAGVPLLKCLSVVSEQITDKRLKGILQQMKRDLSDGQSFSEALGHHPQIFSHLLISSVRVSEINGMIAESLETLANHLEREQEFKAKLVSAFTYPVIVILMAVGVVIFMLTFVFPQFTGVFQELNLSLPLPTRILIASSDFLRNNIKNIFLIFVATAIGAFSLRNRPELRAFWDKAKFKLPLLGAIIKKYTIVRLTSSLGTLLKSGVEVLEAIKLTSDIIHNNEIKALMQRASAMIAEGQQIAFAFAQGQFLPQFVIQTIAIGEQSGQLPEMLMDLSAHYDLELQEKSQRMASAIEPVMLIFLGGIVAMMAVSLIVPLFRMPSAVKSTF